MKVKLKKDASEFRNELGFGITDSVNLNSLQIKLDTITLFKRLSNNFSSMAISITKPEKKFILINSDHSIGRQNFSICHELYHLYKDEDFQPHHSRSDGSSPLLTGLGRCEITAGMRSHQSHRVSRSPEVMPKDIPGL